MAKDIIFRQRPPEVQTYVKRHLKVNDVIEKMKKTIQYVTTLTNAAAILRHEYPYADVLMIYAALNESFNASNEEIGQVL